MNFESAKKIVNNFANSSIEEIEDVLFYIADQFKKKYSVDFNFAVEFEEGAYVKYERDSNGLQQVEIGDMYLSLLKTDKELGESVDLVEEKKQFVELILSVFHELRHVMQNHYIQDEPKVSKITKRFTTEMIINDVFPGFITYNYEQSATEIDAMMFSLIQTVAFFEGMNLGISKDEVFEIMKEKELSFCSYDLSKFGDSYDSALEYFDSLLGNMDRINEMDKLLKDFWKTLDSQQKGEVSKFIEAIYEAEDIDSQLDILKEISLTVKPELKETYPLYDSKKKENISLR